MTAGAGAQFCAECGTPVVGGPAGADGRAADRLIPLDDEVVDHPPMGWSNPNLHAALAVVGASLVAYVFARWVLDLSIPFGVLLQGVILGCVTALLAYSLFFVFRASGTVGVAQAPIGALGASVALILSAEHGWPYVPVVIVALVIGTGSSVLVGFGITARFLRAPRIVRLLVVVGAALLAQGLAAIVPPAWDLDFFPSSPLAEPFDVTITIADFNFHASSVITVVVTALVTVGLVVFMRFSSMGRSLGGTAGVPSPYGAAGRMVAWTLAGVLAAGALVFRAGLIGLAAPGFVSYVVLLSLPAVVACVAGRMQSLPVMLLAAVAVETASVVVLWNYATFTPFLPVLVGILVVVLVLGRGVLGRETGADLRRWLDAVRPRRGLLAEPVPLVLVPIVCLAAIVLPVLLSDRDTNLAASIAIYALIAVSVSALARLIGEINLAGVALAAVGGAAGASLNVNEGAGPLETILVAAACAVGIALLVALPGLVLRGQAFAVLTLGLAYLVPGYLLDNERFDFLPDSLLDTVRRRPVLGLSIASEQRIYYLCLIVLGLALLGAWLAERSGAIAAIFDRPSSTAATYGARVGAIALSGLIAGLGGGLLVLHQQALGEAIFSPSESLWLVALVVIGGIASIRGAVIAAVVIGVLDDFVLDQLSLEYRYGARYLLAGAAMLVVLFLLPAGIDSALFRRRAAATSRVTNQSDTFV